MEMTLKHQRYQPGRHFLPEIQNDYVKKPEQESRDRKVDPRGLRDPAKIKQTDRRSREFSDQWNGPFRMDQNWGNPWPNLDHAVKKLRRAVKDGNQTVPRSLKRMHQKRVN